jgi:ABC-2 type transport system permease protein
VKFKRYVKLYFGYLAQNLKSLMEFRLDFFIGLVGFFFLQACGVIFISLVFSSIPNLKGWSFYEVLFIYGFAQIPRGLDHVFTDNLWLYAGWKIAKGEMDRLLTRPLNPLFQLIAERFQPDGIGEFLIGLILTILAATKLGIEFTVGKVLVFIVSVICGAIIITAIKLFYTSFAFWVKRSQSYLYTAYNFNEFCYYPISIYNKTIQFILTFIIPFAVTSYFPASYLLGKGTFELGFFFPIIVSVIGLSVSYFFWKSGLKHYESAGS